MRIPDIQERLFEIADEYEDEEIRFLASALSRRKSITRAEPSSEPMSDELRSSIYRFVKSNPGMPQAKIAAKFNVNPGRVSETMRGYRL